MHIVLNKKYVPYIFIIILYFYFIGCHEHFIYSKIMLAVFLGVGLCTIIIKKRVLFSRYFILELTFIAYCIFQNVTGISVHKSVAWDAVQTLMVCFLFELMMYQILMHVKSLDTLLKIFVFATSLATLSLFFFGWRTIIVGRFLQNSNVNIWGISLNTAANTYAMGMALASIMAFYFWQKERNIVWAIAILVELLAIMLAGSRTALGFAGLGICALFLFKDKKGILKRIMTITFLGILAFVLVMKVPILYENIGSRLENVIDVLVTGQTNESSFNTRQRLIRYGVSYIAKEPIVGYGLNNFRYIATIKNGVPGYYSHNNFIEIMFSGGIIGFVLYYSKYIYVLNLARKSLKKPSADHGLLLMLVVIVILQLVCEYWTVPYNVRGRMIIQIYLLFLSKMILTKDELRKPTLIKVSKRICL